MCVAVPFGLGAAVYLSEYASPGARNFLQTRRWKFWRVCQRWSMDILP